VDTLGRGDVVPETILVPMNIVEPEPLDELIPLCESRGVGVTIMKPLATGLLPARLALRWLLRQPIASACPGATTIAEVEENALAAEGDLTPDADELASVAAAKAELARVRCRLCGECLPCPVNIPIGDTLGTDVMFDHYRTMGPAGFRNFRWSRAAIQTDLASRRPTIAAIEACTRCGDCEPRCRYGLPIVDMLQSTLPAMRDMVKVYEAKLG
jgi:predicted aldo/keto reductase-like oxidoreductase